MPTRVIEGDIWRDEWFGTLGFMEQALWIGLFSSCADCQGRMLDNVALIRATIWPYQEVSLESINVALAGFAAEGKVLRYTANGKRYMQILRWWRYQYPRWATASKLPPPEAWQDHVRTGGEKGVLEDNWGSRESRIATEDAFLTELRNGTPSREPLTAPSVSVSVSVLIPDPVSAMSLSPSGAPIADEDAPAAPEVLSESDDAPTLEEIRHAAYRVGALAEPGHAYAAMKAMVALFERAGPPQKAWRGYLDDAEVRLKGELAQHRTNGARLPYLLGVLEDKLGLREARASPEPQDSS